MSIGSESDAAQGQDLLAIVASEMKAAVGFEQDAELRDNRSMALRFFKGDMSKDIPSLKNRSSAVSTDLSDAVKTLMSDLMEIFTGGDDVVAFKSLGPDDEKAARQETDFLNLAVWQDNEGFKILHAAIMDALLLKIGVLKHWWEVVKKSTDETFQNKNAAEVALSSQEGELVDVTQTAPGLYSFTLRRTKDSSYAKYAAVPPDDFAVAKDTIDIADATYCVMRSRPRVQDLISEGYDPDTVRSLTSYTDNGSTIAQDRDNAGENTANQGQPSESDESDLRQVEIREHYVRVLGEGNKLVIKCLVTNADATKALPKDGKTEWDVPRIPFAVGSPYLVSHRMYGQSLADQMFEIQKIKTVLTRGNLDSIYFALNARYEVNMQRSTEFTMFDLLRNEPNVPVRTQGEAIKPLASATTATDYYAGLEFYSTVGEQRSGVVRNAQGLNPDTLHDTAKGALMLMSAAQKRTRMIARVLAETLFKPLYLGLHAELRENASVERIEKISGDWVPVSPTNWAERNQMTVEVGLGAAGVDADIAKFNTTAGITANLIALQGGSANGPWITPDNVYNQAHDMLSKLHKKADTYITDPKTIPPQQQPAPPPDPKMEDVKRKAMADQANQQLEMRKQDLQHSEKIRQQDIEGQLKAQEIETDAQVETVTSLIDGHTKAHVARVSMGGDQTG